MVQLTKWRKKNSEITAHKFVYTTKGVAELDEFCGDSLGLITKARHPNAKAQAQLVTMINDDLNTLMVRYIVEEGDYVYKDANGDLHSMTAKVFLDSYDEVEVKPPSFVDSLIKEYTARTVWERGSEDFLGVYNTIKHFPIVEESSGQFTGGFYFIVYDAAKFTYECMFDQGDSLPLEIVRIPKNFREM